MKKLSVFFRYDGEISSINFQGKDFEVTTGDNGELVINWDDGNDIGSAIFVSGAWSYFISTEPKSV